MKVEFDVYIVICPVCRKVVRGLTAGQARAAYRNHFKYVHMSNAPEPVDIVRVVNEVEVPDDYFSR